MGAREGVLHAACRYVRAGFCVRGPLYGYGAPGLGPAAAAAVVAADVHVRAVVVVVGVVGGGRCCERAYWTHEYPHARAQEVARVAELTVGDAFAWLDRLRRPDLPMQVACGVPSAVDAE